MSEEEQLQLLAMNGMLVRCDEDGKCYLYDLVRIKKETSKPLEQ